MTAEEVEVARIAAGWSAGVGVAGLVLLWSLRRQSLRWLLSGVVVVTLAAVLSGLLGTAQEMFIDAHDFGVVRIVVGVSVVVGLILAALVGAGFARESRRLTRAAVDLGDTGQFEVTKNGPQELRLLESALADTAQKLAASREREITLENSRRELVSWVSHDLRTPLAGLRAMAEALEDGLVPDRTEYYRRIRSEVKRMTRMVDDLFELSRIHAGVLNLRADQLCLTDVVSETLASAEPVAKAYGVCLSGRAETGASVVADPAELARVLGNLVANAIRHTPAGGEVAVVGKSSAAGIELSVTDACGGIAEAELSRVFEVAWQGSPARTPEADPIGSGAGLGLAIVKGIVEAHQGQVSVNNTPPGCRFVVQLPR